jgi:hypothetical protein
MKRKVKLQPKINGMVFKIENKTIDRSRVGVPAMNYGQMQRYAKYKRVAYEIEISPEGFYEKTVDWFNTFRAETIEDSGIARKGDFPVYDKYEAAGFPGLRRLIDENKKYSPKLYFSMIWSC